MDYALSCMGYGLRVVVSNILVASQEILGAWVRGQLEVQSNKNTFCVCSGQS